MNKKIQYHSDFKLIKKHLGEVNDRIGTVNNFNPNPQNTHTPMSTMIKNLQSERNYSYHHLPFGERKEKPNQSINQFRLREESD